MSISDFLDLMPNTVTVEPFVSRDTYGVATYGTAVDYQARVNFKSHFARGANGENILSRGTIWLASAIQFDVRSRVTLEDGTTPQIIDANGETDETGDILYVRLDFA